MMYPVGFKRLTCNPSGGCKHVNGKTAWKKRNGNSRVGMVSTSRMEGNTQKECGDMLAKSNFF
jgi:hypothetical protein